MNQNRFPVSNEKGIALITAIILLVIIAALGIFGVNTSIVEGWRSSNYFSAKNAHFSADAGIEDGISRLVSGAVSDSGSKTSTTWNNTASYTSSNFSNSFTIKHRLVGSPSVVATTTAGRPHYLIRSTGTYGTASKTIEAVIALNVTNNSPFTGAMIGCDGVTVASNGSTNSYSSSGLPANGNEGNISTTNANGNITFSSNADINGAVHATGDISLASNTDLHAQNVLANGNITMNGNAEIYDGAFSGGNISLASNSRIYGNATASGTISTSGNALIDGTRSPNSPPGSPYVPNQACDPLNVTTLFSTAQTSISGSNNNGELGSYYSGGAYSIGGNNNSTLGSANPNDRTRSYYLNSFSMNSNSALTVSGDVTLYVSGNFTLSSNSRMTLASGATLTIYDAGTFTLNSNTSINNSGYPANLIIYSDAVSSSHSDYRVKLNSNSGMRGVVYAPNAAITVSSNSDLYGSVRGDFINQASNATFHYDEDLATANFGVGNTITGYSLVSWRQIFN